MTLLLCRASVFSWLQGQLCRLRHRRTILAPARRPSPPYASACFEAVFLRTEDCELMNSTRKHLQEKRWRTTHKTSALGGTDLCLFLLVVVVFTTLSCGGGSSVPPPEVGPQVAGNWQFTLTTTSTSFTASPLQGGFLLQQNGSITGQIEFSILLPPSSYGSGNTNCNSGTATVTGTMRGQSVNLTATIGSLDQNGNPTSQTIALSGGALGSNNSSMQNGNYSVTSGYSLVNGELVACGNAGDAGNWRRTLGPPLT